jgi:hypothetical protein
MAYIFELRLLVENKFGKKITTKSDASKLRIAIFREVKEFVSESTIRRFFLLMKSNNSFSIASLDILSNYVGFKNFKDFEAHQNNKIISIVTSNNFYDSFLINELENKKEISIFETNLLINYVKTLVETNATQKIQLFFNNEKTHKLIVFNYNIHNLFAQQIGKLLFDKSHSIEIKDLTSTRFFLKLVLYRYVDIQNKSIEEYYKVALKTAVDQSEITFMYSVLCLNAFYFDNSELAVIYYNKIIINNQNYSIELEGRLALIKYLITDKKEEFLNTAKRFADNIHFFSIDIVQYLLFKNNLDLLKEWYAIFDLYKRPFNNWISNDIDFTYKIVYFILHNKLQDVNMLLNNSEFTSNSKTTITKIINTLNQSSTNIKN